MFPNVHLEAICSGGWDSMFIYDKKIPEPESVSRKPALTPVTSAIKPGLLFEGISLGTLLKIAARHWRLIVAASIVGGLSLFTLGQLLPRKYIASTEIYLDPRELQILDRSLTTTNQDSAGYANIVESQQNIINSTSVLNAVIDQLHLERDPEFGVHPPSSEPVDELERSKIITTLRSHLSVRHPERSYILSINATSRDPQQAARLANSVAQTYLKTTEEAKTHAARRATAELSSGLEEQKQKFIEAANKVQEYKARNNLIGPKDTLVSDQQLIEMNQQLTLARTKTLEAQARYDQVSKISPNSFDASSLPELLNSTSVSNLRSQLIEARKRLAQLQNELGPLHPAFKAAQIQVNDYQNALSEEIARYKQSAKNELLRARDNEVAIDKKLDVLKQQNLVNNKAITELDKLLSEAEAYKNRYLASLNHSNETSQQELLTTSNARIIGEALAPTSRASPPSASILAIIGAFLGALIGYGLALIFDPEGHIKFEVLNIHHKIRKNKAKEQQNPKQQPMTDVANPKLVGPESDQESPAKALLSGHGLSDKNWLKSNTIAQGRTRDKYRSDFAGRREFFLKLLETDVAYFTLDERRSNKVVALRNFNLPTLYSKRPSSFTYEIEAIYRRLGNETKSRLSPCLAIIGANDKKARTIVALNLALAAQEIGLRVALIDNDTQNSCLSQEFILENQTTQTSRRRKLAPTVTPLWKTTKEGVGFVSSEDREVFFQKWTDANCEDLPFNLAILDGITSKSRMLEHAEPIDGIFTVVPSYEDRHTSIHQALQFIGRDNQSKLLGVISSKVWIEDDIRPQHLYA